MKGTELARTLALLLKPRIDVAMSEALNLVRIAFGEEPLTDKRARAGRAGGARSAEVRRAANGTAQPKQARSKPEAKVEAPPEAKVEATSKQNEFGSVGASAEPRLARKQDLSDIYVFSGSGSENSEPPLAPRRRSGRHEIPKDWKPKERHEFYAGEHGVDVEQCAATFRARHKARGTRLLDWDAEFDGWLINAPALGLGRRELPPGLVEHSARTGRTGRALETPSVPRKQPIERRDVVPMSATETLAVVDVARAAMDAAAPARPNAKTTPAAPQEPSSAAGAAQ